MRKLVVNTKDASASELLKLARKCGFVVKSGGKHYKVKTSDGKFITTIPRHNFLKRETTKGIIEKMNLFGASINFI